MGGPWGAQVGTLGSQGGTCGSLASLGAGPSWIGGPFGVPGRSGSGSRAHNNKCTGERGIWVSSVHLFEDQFWELGMLRDPGLGSFGDPHGGLGHQGQHQGGFGGSIWMHFGDIPGSVFLRVPGKSSPETLRRVQGGPGVAVGIPGGGLGGVQEGPGASWGTLGRVQESPGGSVGVWASLGSPLGHVWGPGVSLAVPWASLGGTRATLGRPRDTLRGPQGSPGKV